MNFSAALLCLKNGSKITRKGWSGQGQWLEIQEPPANADGFKCIQCRTINQVPDVGWKYKPTLSFIVVHMTSGHVIPWTASQKDILFDDWEIVE